MAERSASPVGVPADTAGDGLVHPQIHASHRPEPSGLQLLPGLTYCRVCCYLLAANVVGVRRRGVEPCTGPRRMVLRGDGQVVVHV